MANVACVNHSQAANGIFSLIAREHESSLYSPGLLSPRLHFELSTQCFWRQVRLAGKVRLWSEGQITCSDFNEVPQNNTTEEKTSWQERMWQEWREPSHTKNSSGLHWLGGFPAVFPGFQPFYQLHNSCGTPHKNGSRERTNIFWEPALSWRIELNPKMVYLNNQMNTISTEY